MKNRHRHLIVSRGRSSTHSTKVPTYRTILRTLDISVRYLAHATLRGGSFDYADELLRGWSTDIMRYGNYQLSATGREVFDGGQAFVVMSNHASLLDIPALIAAAPRSLRMVAKQELMKIPVWGRAMQASGFIPISRGDRERAIEQLETAKQRLRAGVSVWIAPEGTRSRDGQLAPFKKGGFHVALDLGIPILPTWIEGSRAAMPPDSFTVHTGKELVVHFGQPIATHCVAPDDLPELMARVRCELEALAAATRSTSARGDANDDLAGAG